MTGAPLPIGLLAELTHRCPLQCPYCSNPLHLDRRSAELDTATWKRVFTEADELGVLQLHLSGGEPTARADLVELVAHCAKLGLYTNLITSGVLLDRGKLQALADAGLDHVQLSLQDIDPVNADHIGGFRGGHGRKLEIGSAVVDMGLPLTINAVIHRGNIGSIEKMVDLAISMGARRIEIAHAQYYGWALWNRAALMPTERQVMEAARTVEELRARHAGRIVIDTVVPDYYAEYPKACMGGWGSRAINITPSGKALPCHAAETIQELRFDNVKERSLNDIWHDSAAFRAFRDLDWMEEPCLSCSRKETCRGGCRCQALALTGRATAADPACVLSEFHDELRSRALAESAAATSDFRYRRIEA
jgi:pyrroloquinoline quinone biosynthesis protein E